MFFGPLVATTQYGRKTVGVPALWSCTPAQHGRANAVGQLLDAASLLRDRPEVLIACVGDGSRSDLAALVAEARRRGLS